MFKKITVLMCLTLSIVLFCMAVSATEAETTDIDAIYVSGNATEGGTGAIDAPVATLAEAYSLLGNNGTIFLMDTVSVSATMGDCFIAPTHTGKIAITSAEGYNGALDLTEIMHFHFGGDTELNNIGIVANEVVLTADNHTVTMGEGLEMSSPSADIYRGGHTYCGAKIHLAAYAPCETANITCEAAGGKLNVYSGEYCSVCAWYGDTVTMTGGETQILLDTRNETDRIWLRYLCPGMYSSAIENSLTCSGSTVTVIVNSGVNTLDAYRFTKNSFSGSMTVNWLLHNSAQGSSYAFIAKDFYPADDAEYTLNVYADQSNVTAKGCAKLLMRGASVDYLGENGGDSSLNDYCAENHNILTENDGRLVCIFCGYEQCRHRTVENTLVKAATCTHGDLYEVVCTDLCKESLGISDEQNIDSDNHDSFSINYLYDPGLFVIEHRCEGCGKLFRTDHTDHNEMPFGVKVGVNGTKYSASNPTPVNGDLYFNDFTDAMNYIAIAANAYSKATLNIVGNVDVPANYSTPEAYGEITITGGKLWFKEAPRRFYMNGDVTFENITFRTNTTSGMVICAQNNKLVMGEGIVMGNAGTIPTEEGFSDCNCVKMFVVGGFEGLNDNTINTDITIRSGDYWYIGGWNYNASTNDGVGKITIGKTNSNDKLQVFYLCPFSRGDGFITKQAESTIIVDGSLDVKRFYVTTLNDATTNINYVTNVVLKGDIIGYNDEYLEIPFDLRGCPIPYPKTIINVYTDSRVATAVEDSYVFLGHPDGTYSRDPSLSRLRATINSYSYEVYCKNKLGGHIDSDTDLLCDKCGCTVN